MVVLGSDLARQFNAKVGDTVTLRDVKFDVVGILAPTLTAPDKRAMVPMAAAQQLFIKTMPPLVQSKLDASDIATGIIVYPKPGVDPEALKPRLEATPGQFVYGHGRRGLRPRARQHHIIFTLY